MITAQLDRTLKKHELTRSDIAIWFIPALLTIACSMALRGWVMTYLWLWFAVPLGAPALGIAQALGLCMVATIFTSGTTGRSVYDIKTKDMWKTMFVQPFIGLGIGWAIKQFL